MAEMLRVPPSHLYGLVDMGSNGIRFSITDTSPATARSLPTIFQDRSGISLYDAQFSTGKRGPIPQPTIDEVLGALVRFKTVCADFGVPETNIRILATEATRTAVNSEDYRRQIRETTGWEVDMLPKEAEGRIGAMGVASSFSTVEGLVMDLGGGSTQITWMIAEKGRVQTSPKGSFSFPYGAAAMTRQLAEIEEQPDPKAAKAALAEKMEQEFQRAFVDLALPETLDYRSKHGGLSLYLSGGGFRGWGYLLMDQHKISPYPIPIINGFHVTKYQFQQTADISAAAASDDSIFRISKRRADQVPAVAFLVNILVSALPMIKDIRFCQGGVREGFLYDSLPESTRAIDPLPSATSIHGSPSAPALASLLASCLPGANNLDRSIPASFTPPILRAIADMMYTLSPLPKESRSLAALYAPITGLLASAHGVSHTDRAIIALTLCQRWAGDLAPPHGSLQVRLRAIISQQEAWWCNYLGSVAALVGSIYPSGVIPEGQSQRGGGERIKLSAWWSDGLGKKGLEQGVVLQLRCRTGDAMTSPEAVNGVIDDVEKVGKKKNRIGGRDHGYGIVVKVKVDRVDGDGPL